MQEWLFERLANMVLDRFYESPITGARSSVNDFAGTEPSWAISFYRKFGYEAVGREGS